ncbi:MAG: hypothetical protein KBF73_08745 [Flavobacteriales bacterium]|nr:hypothetical protein [Flavobacteriales bacterium]
MKGKLYVFVLLLTSHLSYGQDAYERYTNFFAIEVAPVVSSTGVGISPTFSVYRTGHKIDVGALVKVYDLWKEGPGIMGGYFGYKYYPNLRKNTFNLFFGYHATFSASNRGKLYPVIVVEPFDIKKYPDKAYLNEHMVGIGFDAQLGNNFYMFNDFSAGVLIKWYTYEGIETESEIRSTGMVRLGIGFNVGHKRAK